MFSSPTRSRWLTRSAGCAAMLSLGALVLAACNTQSPHLPERGDRPSAALTALSHLPPGERTFRVLTKVLG
jgi:hypothetical protein